MSKDFTHISPQTPASGMLRFSYFYIKWSQLPVAGAYFVRLPLTDVELTRYSLSLSTWRAINLYQGT